MLRRLLLGLSEGLVIGLALGVACVRGLGLDAPGGIVLALLGACAGFLVGLVAGRPIWGRNAKTEALLKGGAGALVGSGLAFALQHWLKVQVDLSALALGVGPAGQLTAVALPAVTTALALFFELDDEGPGVGHAAGTRPPKRRVASEGSDLANLDEPEDLADEVDPKLEKR